MDGTAVRFYITLDSYATSSLADSTHLGDLIIDASIDEAHTMGYISAWRPRHSLGAG